MVVSFFRYLFFCLCFLNLFSCKDALHGLKQPKHNETGNNKDKKNLSKTPGKKEFSQNGLDVLWYVHLQRNFVPYSEGNSKKIENSYQDFLKNNSFSKSSDFEVEIGDKVYCYYVNFFKMEQINCQDIKSYRTARRIEYDRLLTPDEKNRSIPISYETLIKIGAHVQNYLTKEELEAKKVSGQDKPDFFPINAGIIKDSLNDSL
jgi:hypothetical protein